MPSGIDRSPVHLLHRASQAVELAFAHWTRGTGLTPRQLAVLMAIEAYEDLSQMGIAHCTNIDRSTLAAIVRRLKDKGLVKRRRTREDARAYAVNLTDEGRRVLRAVLPVAEGVDTAVLGVLPGARREAFMAALASIVKVLEKPPRLQARRPLYRFTG
jgi:DNA-binding MarR family transcriptional regulator